MTTEAALPRRVGEPSEILKATGPGILRIGFDPDQLASLRHEQVSDLAYHLIRVLQGQSSAASEWEHLGLKVRLDPWPRA